MSTPSTYILREHLVESDGYGAVSLGGPPWSVHGLSSITTDLPADDRPTT